MLNNVLKYNKNTYSDLLLSLLFSLHIKIEVYSNEKKKWNTVRVLLICEIHSKFCKITLKWLRSSQVSDSLTAGDRHQVCIADTSLTSREHPCDVATRGRCDWWASREEVNCERGELSAQMGTVRRFATTFERRMQGNGTRFSSASGEGRLSLYWQLVAFLGVVCKASSNSNVLRIYKQRFILINHMKCWFKVIFVFLIH